MPSIYTKPKITIHKDITPENASTHGFEWVQDTIYDEEAPVEAMNDIQELVDSGEYILGAAASSHPYFCGLYKKI